MSGLKVGAIGEDGTGAVVAGIGRDENMIVVNVRVVDQCKAFVQHHQLFDSVESVLMLGSPSEGKISIF